MHGDKMVAWYPSCSSLQIVGGAANLRSKAEHRLKPPMSTPPQTKPASPKPSPIPRRKLTESSTEGPPAERPVSRLVHRSAPPPPNLSTTRDDSALVTSHTGPLANAGTVRRTASFHDRITGGDGKEPSLSREVWKLPPKTTKPSSLAKFVETHQSDFPMCVEITGGSQWGISVGAIYTIHFVKNTTVINVQDGKGVPQYYIPLNSSVQIGIVYPTTVDSDNQICKNVVFKGAKEVMAAEPIPKILRVANMYVDSNPSFTLAENELLIVKKVRKIRPFGQQNLVTYSLTYNTTKLLRENCNVLFLTAPENVFIYPVEFYAHFHQSLPLKAIVKFADDTPDASPTVEIVTLADCGVSRSIIATPYSGKGGRPQEGERPPLIEIPLNADVELDKAAVSENDDLCSESLDLIRDFDPKRVVSMAPTVDQILHARPGSGIRQGYEKMGLELESILIQSRPPAKLPQPEGHYSTPHDCLSSQSDAIQTQLRVKSPRDNINSNGGVDLGVQLNTLQRTVDIMQHQMDSVENLARRSHTLVGILKAQLEQATAATQQLTARVQALTPNESFPPNPPMAETARPQQPATVLPQLSASSTDKETNRKLLAQLSCEEVGKVLALMNLAQYQECFQAENISGEVLVECDDEDILEYELGVKTKLHRIRLVKLIAGCYSIRDMLEGRDVYGVADSTTFV